MTSIHDVHRAETIAYVLDHLRPIHRAEQDRVDLYARQPYTAALEQIARDRAHRLGQLVRAIEAGLYDRLDADEAKAATASDGPHMAADGLHRLGSCPHCANYCTRCYSIFHTINECEEEDL